MRMEGRMKLILLFQLVCRNTEKFKFYSLYFTPRIKSCGCKSSLIYKDARYSIVDELKTNPESRSTESSVLMVQPLNGLLKWMGAMK